MKTASERRLFSCIGIMQWFVIRIFHFPEASVQILLISASAAAADDPGTFSDRLRGEDSIFIFHHLHKIILSFFVRMGILVVFYASEAECP